MKKFFTFLTALMLISFFGNAQKQLILCTTGYGFDRTTSNGLGPDIWTYIQKWSNLTSGGQDAGITAVRLHIQWEQYEPTAGNYQGAKLAQAVQAILSLKPGMKVALHFPYQRPGPQPGHTSEGFLAEDEIAKIPDGTKVQKQISYTIPSIYSQTGRTRFYNFVSNALSAVSAHYSNILYVVMGNGSAEEFIMPVLKKGEYYYPGMYEAAAVQAWRTEYLPCRYPGQSTVTWGGTTYTIASAPSHYPGEWTPWTSDIAKEYHRFASWGLMRFYKGFRDIVKSKSTSLKVLGFPPGFGTGAGNGESMHNSMLPMSQIELDGIYTSEGEQNSNWRKILSLDVLKGTNSSKIAAVEFDPYDLGANTAENPATPGERYHGLIMGYANEWIPRAFKHGADYVHFAMKFFPDEVDQMAPLMASLKATYVTPAYTPPARTSAAVTANIFPNSFGGSFLFDNAWTSQGGDTWATTDLSPKSVNMIDAGYWENIWSCTPPTPCDFNMTATTTTPNVTTGASVTLTSACTGSACSGLSYVWSGTGMPTGSTNSSVTFNVPSTAGTYTYTVTVNKSGCTAKTATVQVIVGSACNFNITAGNTNANPTAGAALNLNYTCTGGDCGGATFAWSGNGISGNQNPKSITAPSTPGTYTYQIAANKSGCAEKTATTSITVGGGSGSGCVVNKVRLQFRDAGGCCMSRLVGAKIQGSNNGGSTWTDLYTFSSNGTGSFQDFPISNSTAYSSARFVASSTGWGELRELEFYNGTTKLSGTTFGTDNYANAFDGNTATEWHAPTTPGPNNYAGMNFTGCSAPAACDFNMSASASPSSVNVSGTVSLSYTCTGADCSGVTYAWSGQGISGNQSPKSITAPATAGTYTYTITASKSGCANKTATASVTTTSGSTTYNQCQEAELMNGNGAITSDPNASNNETRGEKTNYNHYVDYVLTGVPSAGTYYVTLRYYSGSALPIIGVQANGGTSQSYTLPSSGSWNIVWANYQFSVNLNAGSNTIRISGTGGGSCRQDRICVSNTSGSPAVLGTDPAEMNTLKALSVLPNPSNGIFQTDFYLEKGKRATIIISDLQGRIIYRQSVIGQGQHREKINLNNKASGTLLLQLQQQDGTQVRKMSIIR